MTIPVWPADLPPFMLCDGYGEAFLDGRLTSRADRGPPKQRRGSSAAPRPAQGVFSLDEAGLARFRRFWTAEARGNPFMIRAQTSDGRALAGDAGAALTTDAGVPLQAADWWLVMAGDQAPSVTPSGVRYRIAMQLAVLR